MESSPAEAYGATLQNVIRYARSGEKLVAAAATLIPAATALAALRDYDPDLSPEVNVAFGHVQEAIAALRRASEFQNARFDAANDRVWKSLQPPTEGDTT